MAKAWLETSDNKLQTIVDGLNQGLDSKPFTALVECDHSIEQLRIKISLMYYEVKSGDTRYMTQYMVWYQPIDVLAYTDIATVKIARHFVETTNQAYRLIEIHIRDVNDGISTEKYSDVICRVEAMAIDDVLVKAKAFINENIGYTQHKDLKHPLLLV